MVEYSGYTPVPIMDWSSITGKIATDLQKTIDERQAKREALDKEAESAVSKINEYQSSKAPTFNQFIMDGANNARDFIYEQNKLLKRGEITPSEYSKRVSSLSDSWKRLADNAKTFDADYLEQVKRIESGEASAQEIFQSKINSSIANLKDKKLYINPNDARVYIAQVDPHTNQVNSEADLWDVQTMNAGLNQKANKVDLFAETNKFVKMLGVGAKIDPATGKYAISEKLVGDFKNKTKPRIIESIMSNPQKAASALADNSDLDYSFTNDSNNKDSKKILLVRDENGIWTPKLTDAQEKKAREIVGNVIDSQISYKEKEPERPTGMSFDEWKIREDYKNKLKEGGKKSENINNRYQNVLNIANHPGYGNNPDLYRNALYDDKQYPGYRIKNLHRDPGSSSYTVKIFSPIKDQDGNLTGKENEITTYVPASQIYSKINSWLNAEATSKLDLNWEEIKQQATSKASSSQAVAPKVNLNATQLKGKK